MNLSRRTTEFKQSGKQVRLLLAVLSCGGMLAAESGYAQGRTSLAGEAAAEALKESIEAQPYNLQYGPVRLRVGASLGVNYTDNVFYSYDGEDDVMIRPEATLDALWPVTELNTLALSLGLSYEWYLENNVLNGDAPLINPGSELAFNVYVGDFHIQVHDRFLYQESLFYNSLEGGGQPFYNFNDVGTFARLDNNAGLLVTWDLNKVVLTAGYDHENFIPYTASYEYMERASEWFTSSASFFLGDHLQTGVEGAASLHDYNQETVLNDNWRGRIGPFVEATYLEGVTIRAGGGYDTAQYDAAADPNSDYASYYWYARIGQETRLFTHSLQAGREYRLGDNANNLETTYVRYAIDSPVVANVELGANASINFADEFGGSFEEEFTYYEAGVGVGWLFHRDWRTDLRYSFRYKNSDLPLRDYRRNQVTLAVAWSF